MSHGGKEGSGRPETRPLFSDAVVSDGAMAAWVSTTDNTLSQGANVVGVTFSWRSTHCCAYEDAAKAIIAASRKHGSIFMCNGVPFPCKMLIYTACGLENH